ncbi:ribonuclease HII [Fusibacter paucivorans]|uniref:Ribonuclease HII n=1 Tax=Fusibacter paucivorans TaxID=76009 RepID=A0ABS5PQN6_9FIRM|nr:ribonuclease HII [Fusibacter paucivorans]MBS7527475.1 ribonuclease HII [Fusibacter paucivorans]
MTVKKSEQWQSIRQGEKLPVKQLSVLVDSLDADDFEGLRAVLQMDQRKAVQNIIKRKDKQLAAAEREKARMAMMFAFERDYSSRGFQCIGGIDEAGRGPLLGPVVAAVAVLNEASDWSGIDDSKKLSEQQREKFYDKIKQEAICYGIGIASHEEIDQINILNATKLAMKRAIEAAEENENATIDFLLIDAVKLDDIPIGQLSLIKGDQRSASIAAASILAKVTRDHMMQALHDTYPAYGIDQHKGYGTKQHYEALDQYGPTPYHRQSFLSKWHEKRSKR